MTRPLAAGLPDPVLNHASSNAGLYFDKFVDTWPDGLTKRQRSKDDTSLEKKAWLEKFGGKRAGDPALLLEAATRVVLLTEAMNGRRVVVESRSRLVAGTGTSTPVEIGLSWHPTLGVPFVPGSSLKGLTRSWVTQWKGMPEADSDVQRIFGSPTHGSGSVCFLDLNPLGPVDLVVDILNPHYGDYHKTATGAVSAPGDWHNPIPVFFLAVESAVEFVTGVIPRKEASADDAKTASEWLLEALEHGGAGAKTAVGYGRFVESSGGRLNESLAELAVAAKVEQDRLSGKSELAIELEGKLNLWLEEKGNFTADVTGSLDRIEQASDAGALSVLAGPFQVHYGEFLKNPDMKIKEGKFKKKAKQLDLVRRYLQLREKLGK